MCRQSMFKDRLGSVSATGSEFQRVGPEYIRLDLNKSNLGMGTLSFLE